MAGVARSPRSGWGCGGRRQPRTDCFSEGWQRCTPGGEAISWMTKRARTMTDRERMTKGAAPGASGEDPREARLQALFTAAEPAADPSEALQHRVAEMAARHEARERQRRPLTRPGGRHWTPWRLGLGLAAAAVLAMIGVGLAPMWLTAHVLQRAEAAVAE